MDDKKISDCADIGDLGLPDESILFPCAGGGFTRSMTLAEIKASARGGTKLYRALFRESNQVDLGDNINVLENTFGAPIVVTRTGVGTYAWTLAGAFPSGKTFARIGKSDPGQGEICLWRGSDDAVNFSDADGDSGWENLTIEIIVYP